MHICWHEGSTMRLVFRYSIFSSIILLGLGQIACADIRVPASLAAKKARDKKAAEERRKRLQPPANVSNYVFQSNSNGITLTWTNPTDSDFSKVLILKNTSPIVDSPTTGKNYAGVTLVGGSQMMYNAASSSFTDTEITEGVTYFYKIFSYDTLLNYASGVELVVGEADADRDGLIEIYTAEMLDNMRYDLAGTSYKTSAAQTTGNTDGCPNSVCHGYELITDIDLLSLLDTNGNGMIDTTMEGIDKNADGDTVDPGEKVTVIDTTADTSWVPVGDNSTGDDTTRFTGIFEGNNHTIANLWVNIASINDVYAGLFGVTGVTNGTVAIRNVGIISGSIHSASRHSSSRRSSYSGGLVGLVADALSITNSYFSGAGGVSSSSSSFTSSGGLVGEVDAGRTMNITNSYFSGAGGVSSSSSSNSSYHSSSGGLVGEVDIGRTMNITNSYFSGAGGVSSSAPIPYSGGLVGYCDIANITNGYFSGAGGVSSSSSSSSSLSSSGGLVGRANGVVTTTNNYWNTNAPQSVNGSPQNPKRAQGDTAMNPAGTTGLTLVQLKATSMSTTSAPSPSGLPHSATDNTKAWDLGADMQLPAVKLCIPTVTGTGPTAITDWTMCASYGALLAGQR